MEIGIVKQYRNRRYGVKLMSHIEDKLLEKGIADCYVSAYGPAQAFWSRCGFEDSGRTAGNGLPIMIKSIKKKDTYSIEIITENVEFYNFVDYD